MIVAEQVQQPVQRQHAQLGLIGVPRLARLAAGDAGRDHDVAELASPEPRPGRRVGPETTARRSLRPCGGTGDLRLADAGIGDERDGDLAARARRRDARRASAPARRRARPRRPNGPCGPSLARSPGRAARPTVGIHRTLRTPSRSAARADAARRPCRRSGRTRCPRRCRPPSSPRRARMARPSADRSG